MNEKEALEIAAAKIFCNCYYQSTGVPAVFLHMNTPPLPDTTCCIDGRKTDLEIAHLYGSDIDAQRLLGRKRRVSFNEETLAEQRTMPLNLRIPNELSNILESKSTKTYKSEKVWLVIRNGYPLWGKADFLNYKDEIIFPMDHPFEKIWLICDSRGNTGVLELGV